MSSPAPAYRISLGGVDISPKISPLLISLTLTDCKGLEADQLDIELDDIGNTLALPTSGATLDVAIGWAGQALVDKGSFKVDEVSHSGPPDRITLRARSADLGLNFRCKVEQSWHATTLGAILTAVALRNNLQPRIDSRMAAVPVAHWDQTESDAEFLAKLAARFDAIGVVKRAKLIFVPVNFAQAATKKRSSGKPYTGVRAYWVKPGRKTLKRVLAGATGHVYRLELPRHSTEAAAQKAAAAQWQQMQAEQAQAAGTRASAAASVPEQDETDLPTLSITRSDADTHHYNNSDRNAYSGVRAYYHDPASAKRRSVLVGLSGNAKHLRETFANEADALQAAQAEWQRIERGVATFELTLARGNALAAAACPVALDGWRPEIVAIEWQANKVTHRIGGSGFTTSIECEVLGARQDADGDAKAPEDAQDVEPELPPTP